MGKLLLDIEDHTLGKFLPLIQSESEPRDGVLGERGKVAIFDRSLISMYIYIVYIYIYCNLVCLYKYNAINTYIYI